MDREIKFRGYSKQLKTWVYGSLIHDTENKIFDIVWFDTEQHSFEVEERSVGQFIERKDRNGKDIFEFDIVKTPHAVIPVGVIKYWQAYHSFEIESPDGDICIGHLYDWSDIEVIGNVFQNSDLLKP